MSNIKEFSESDKNALVAELNRDYIISADDKNKMVLLYPRKYSTAFVVGVNFGAAARTRVYADMNDRMQKLSKRGLEHVRTAVRDSVRESDNMRVVVAMLMFPIDLEHMRNRAIWERINMQNYAVVDMTTVKIR